MYLILINPIGHQTVSKQMKLDLVIVQIQTKQLYFQISNVHMARKYGSQNMPQGCG